MIGPRASLIVGGRQSIAAGIGADEIDPSGSGTTITLALADSADPTPAGNNFDFTAIVTNTGSNAATTLSCAVTLDSSLAYVSSSGAGWAIGASGQVVTATRATLAPGAAPTITVTVTAGNSAITATTTGACTATNATTANDSQNTSVVRPTTSVAVTDSADPVITGSDAFAYSVIATNNGAGTVNTASVAVTLDSSLAYVSGSGTGWSVGVSGQVVTCTRATMAVGAAPTITINVTTGTGGLTASTTAAFSAANAATSNGSQNTTVNLITKDSTSGIYIPTSATQWTNFIARKGLSIANPDSLWLCQEASGNLADSIGSLTLTAAGTPTYAQATTGWSRTGVKTADGNTDRFSAAITVGPTPATTSQTWLAIISLPAAPANTREFWGLDLGSSASGFYARHLTATGKVDNRCVGVSVAGSTNASSGTHAVALTYDRTGSRADICTEQDKIIGTYSSAVLDGNKGMGGLASGSSTSVMVWACLWIGTNGEISNANIKALYQAMGYTITW